MHTEMIYPAPPSYQDAVQSQPNGTDKLFQQQTSVITQQPSEQPRASLTETQTMYRRIGDRLIFDFEKVTCCPGQPSGLDDGVEAHVPSELARAGITISQWRAWVEELNEVQKMAPTICGCMTMFCFPGGLVQSMLCAIFCPISADHPLKCLPCCYGDWYAGLRKWTDHVNAELNPQEMHAKLLTYKPFTNAPRSKNFGNRTAGKDHNYEMSFLAIAVTLAESLVLQQESWDHGVNDGCTSGNGRIL